MDVVKTNIDRVNGTVDLQSYPGKGTSVRIRIPLTLAIVRAVIVQSNGKRFAIPQLNIQELVRLSAGSVQTEIESVHGVPVYRMRGRLLPLVYLNEELKLAKQAEKETDLDEATNIVVLQANDHPFGLVVNEINDSEEIVVKPLSKQLRGLKVFAGATIMGDGKVALILDVVGLAQRGKSRRGAHKPRAESSRKTNVPSICGPRRQPHGIASQYCGALGRIPCCGRGKIRRRMGHSIPRKNPATDPSRCRSGRKKNPIAPPKGGSGPRSHTSTRLQR
jgi:two-component system chemotaxis sensor kinase CheA